jgi:hypothetical protein
MTPRHIAMGVALAGAAALVLFGDRTPQSEVAEAVVRAPRAQGAAQPRAAVSNEPVILALTPRATLIGDGDEAMGGRDNLFGSQDWNPAPPPPSAAASKPAPPPPPVAPPLPFTYLGKAAEAGQWEVYLARGDKTYIVQDKMVIDGMYRVEAIAPPNLTLTYLPLNQVQQLNIGVLD